MANKRQFFNYLMILILLAGLAVWVRYFDMQTDRQVNGLISLSFGYILLFGFVFAQLLQLFKLPMITGYIFAGIILGPHVSRFLDHSLVEKFRFIDDLALSFIALSAGGELHVNSIRKRIGVMSLNVFLQVLIIFGCIFFFVIYGSPYFSFSRNGSHAQVLALAVFLGVIGIARSPASTIAIISETRAKGPFTETILGVTVISDVIIIILFTIAISVAKILMVGHATLNYYKFIALFAEILLAVIIGAFFGKGLAFYIQKVGRDVTLVLLFFGFGITKVSLWMSLFMETHFEASIHLEPLLICISAGFFIQNYSRAGILFLDSLEKVALPIYVFFFSIAGATLDFAALYRCWPLAVCYVLVRIVGIFLSSAFAGYCARDPGLYNRNAWMAYITQAGVAIGLAQISGRQFPEVGQYLSTVVLAVIAINQIIGPVLFKKVLQIVGEVRKI